MNTEFGQRVFNSLVANQTLQKEAAPTPKLETSSTKINNPDTNYVNKAVSDAKAGAKKQVNSASPPKQPNLDLIRQRQQAEPQLPGPIQGVMNNLRHAGRTLKGIGKGDATRRLSSAGASLNRAATSARQSGESALQNIASPKLTDTVRNSGVGKWYGGLSDTGKNVAVLGTGALAATGLAYGAKKLFGKKKEKKDEKEARAEAAFEQGFLDKCAEYKLDPEQVAEYISNNAK